MLRNISVCVFNLYRTLITPQANNNYLNGTPRGNGMLPEGFPFHQLNAIVFVVYRID